MKISPSTYFTATIGWAAAAGLTAWLILHIFGMTSWSAVALSVFSALMPIALRQSWRELVNREDREKD